MTLIAGHALNWLVTWFVHTSLACGVALVAGRWFTADRSRDVLWKAALLAPLATSLLSGSALPNVGGSVDVLTIARRFMPTSLQATRVSVWRAGPSAPAIVTIHDDTLRALQYSLLAAILVPALITTSRTVSSRRRYRRALRGRRAVSANALGVQIDRLGPSGRTVRFSVSRHVESAAAVGAREICVSEVLATLGRTEKEAAIAHELAHVQRRDVTWALFADVVGCVLAIQPLVRVVVRRFRRDAEFICDDIAVARLSDARGYVRTLIRFATAYDASAGAPGYGSSPIVERAERLLRPRATRGRSEIWAASLVMAIVAGGLLVLPRLRTGDVHVTIRTLAGSPTGVAAQQQIAP